MTKIHLVLAALLMTFPLFGQSEAAEAWILYEQGKAALELRGEPGEALQYFRQAIDIRGNYPEAEMGIGDVYVSEGQLLLAEEQFTKAYRFKGALIIPEDQYTILLKLADLHETQDRYDLMEKDLQLLLGDQIYYSSDAYTQFREAFMDTYKNRGIDHLFRLYRMDKVAFAVSAHARLGWLYYRTGLFEKSIRHSLFALNIVVTESVLEIRRHDPLYEFKTVRDFLALSLDDPEIEDLLAKTQFFRTLYYLSTASYSAYMRGEAREMWRIISEFPQAGIYTEQAQRQLISPWEEDRLRTR